MSLDTNSSTGHVISNALHTLNSCEYNSFFNGEMQQNSQVSPSGDEMECNTDAAVNQHNSEEGLGTSSSTANTSSAQNYPSMATGINRKRSVGELSNSNENKKMSVDSNSSRNPASSDLQYNVHTQNRFSALSGNDTEVEDTRFSYLYNPPSENQSEGGKIPPIYVANITNVSNFTKELKHNVTDNFISDVKYDKVKINAKTSIDFRNIVKYLIQTQRSFHSYRDPSNKKFSVVFKNLHQSITESEIVLDLKQRFPSVLKVTRLLKDGIPIPVVAAEFNGTEPLEVILSIDQICNHRVIVERRKKPKGPLQCQRCLDFGHTKNNCNHIINCAFCAGNHYSVMCPKKNETPKCVNCNGNHRADIRDQNCTYFKELTERQSKTPASISRNVNHPQTTPSPQTTSSPQTTPSPQIIQREHFPSLPQRSSIPNFNRTSNSQNQSQTITQSSQNASPTNSQKQETHSDNPIINTIINSITSCIINFINSLIPTIISTIQNSVTEYLTNNGK